LLLTWIAWFATVDMPQAIRLTVHILAAVAEHERDMISARTKAALAAATARGKRLGWANPGRCEDQAHAARNGANATRERADRFAANVLPIMREIRAAGIATLDGTAAALNARGVRTARGGAWHPTTVRNLLAREVSAASVP